MITSTNQSSHPQNIYIVFRTWTCFSKSNKEAEQPPPFFSFDLFSAFLFYPSDHRLHSLVQDLSSDSTTSQQNRSYPTPLPRESKAANPPAHIGQELLLLLYTILHITNCSVVQQLVVMVDRTPGLLGSCQLREWADYLLTTQPVCQLGIYLT